jgi:hypothetical protein
MPCNEATVYKGIESSVVSVAKGTQKCAVSGVISQEIQVGQNDKIIEKQIFSSIYQSNYYYINLSSIPS